MKLIVVRPLHGTAEVREETPDMAGTYSVLALTDGVAIEWQRRRWVGAPMGADCSVRVVSALEAVTILVLLSGLGSVVRHRAALGSRKMEGGGTQRTYLGISAELPSMVAAVAP